MPVARSRIHRVLASSALAAAALLASACATPEERVEERRNQIATPPITHIVLIQLKDPSRARELVEDCNRSLPGIPAVLAYACGEPLASDRPNVMKNYSVGFFVSFRDEEGYKEYTEDPAQLALVEKWRTAWKDVRIFDFLEATGAPFVQPPAAAAPAPATQPSPPPQPATANPPAVVPPTSPPASTPTGPGTAQAQPAQTQPSAPPATPAPSTPRRTGA
ncbi:MAG: Dabb family protein [Phycisphaerae bacterium]|nr:Dabb family protein [Phycisphaerae bacterium]